MKAATRRDRKWNAGAFLFRLREDLPDRILFYEKGAPMMPSIVGKSQRHVLLASDAEASPPFGVPLRRKAPQQAQGKPLRTVRSWGLPRDGVDHTELPTLQNLGGLPATLALTPLFFNSLQRHVGPMFKPEMAGNDLQMGPYRISGANGRVNGVQSADPAGPHYGIVRDPRNRLYLTVADRIMPLAAGSPAERQRAVAMLRQAAVSAYVSIGPGRPQIRNQ
jgi:hypothetical protein